MFGLGPATRIYLAAGVADMRKDFEGRYGLVRDRLSCEPLSGHLFLFCNGQRNRLDYFSAILPRACRSPDPVPPRPYSRFVSRAAFIDRGIRVILRPQPHSFSFGDNPPRMAGSPSTIGG